MQDVERLRAVLEDRGIGGFAARALTNRPAHEIRLAIEDLFVDARHDDVLLLYLSCHGYKDEAGRLYFATTGSRLDRPSSTAISASYVQDLMAHTLSRNVVLLLDCCYSGAFTRGMTHRAAVSADVTGQFKGLGSAVLCSSNALEYSFEVDGGEITRGGLSNSAAQPSLFTGAIIDGLRTGEADLNGDGKVSVDELYDYVYKRVRETSQNQRPTKALDVQGQLIVATSPRGARPRPLPQEVVEASHNPLSSVRLGAVQDLWMLAAQEARNLGPGGGPALKRLTEMTEDDSRQVSAKAWEAVGDVRRSTGPHPRPAPPMPPPRAASPPSPVRYPLVQPTPDARHPVAQPPVAGLSLAQPHSQDGLGQAMGAYFLPFFTALALMRSRSVLARFHVWQCVGIDVLALAYFVVGLLLFAAYGGVRYGTEPIPEGDVVMNVYLASLFLLPVLPRAYCFFALALNKSGRVIGIAPLAERVATRRGRRRV